MVKDKERVAYVECWNYWISKVPQNREAIETSVGHLNREAESHADRARLLLRLRHHRILPGNGRGGAHRGDESTTNNATVELAGIRVGDWED
jgi:hypothetical protein